MENHRMDDPVPADQHIDHSMMDHSMMDHSNMNHMNHMREMAPVEDEVTSQAVDHSMMNHNMDMGGMSASSSMDMMMKMYFHGGYNEVILFDFWRINSIGGLIGSMVGCFLLAIFYEGLKFYREYLFRTSFQPTARSSLPGGDGVYGESGSLNNHRSSSSSSSVTHPRGVQHLDTDQMSIKMVETSIWSKGHFYLTLLHFVQVTLAYLLMLIFMTYNTWLCLATVLGATFGYFLFGWRKTVVLEEPDHCH